MNCKEIIFRYTCGKQQSYIISFACFEHFYQLSCVPEGTHSGQKEVPHDAFDGYFLSIAETLVKSQDSPDSDKQYSCSRHLVDLCQQKTKRTKYTVALMAVHEVEKYISGMDTKSLPDLIVA